jgi:hypothetical protein
LKFSSLKVGNIYTVNKDLALNYRFIPKGSLMEPLVINSKRLILKFDRPDGTVRTVKQRRRVRSFLKFISPGII